LLFVYTTHTHNVQGIARALREAAATATTTATTDSGAAAAQLAAAQHSVTEAQERATAAEQTLNELKTGLDAEVTARHAAEVTRPYCLTPFITCLCAGSISCASKFIIPTLLFVLNIVCRYLVTICAELINVTRHIYCAGSSGYTA
jgi:hypothetical protein